CEIRSATDDDVRSSFWFSRMYRLASKQPIRITIRAEITRPNSIAMAPRSSLRKLRILEVNVIVRASALARARGGVPRLVPQDDRRLQVHFSVVAEDRRNERRDHVPVVLHRILHDLRGGADAGLALVAVPHAVAVDVLAGRELVDPRLVSAVAVLVGERLWLIHIAKARIDEEADRRLGLGDETERVLVDDRQDLSLALGRIRDRAGHTEA